MNTLPIGTRVKIKNWNTNYLFIEAKVEIAQDNGDMFVSYLYKTMSGATEKENFWTRIDNLTPVISEQLQKTKESIQW